MKLYEKYRPATLAEVAGQAKAVNLLNCFAKRDSLGGRAYWITGQSGTGKTTLARIVADLLADSLYITEADAGRVSLKDIDTMKADAWYRPMADRAGRIYIFNEAHGLRRDTIRQLLVLLERLPAHVTVIFTTTKDG